MLRSWVNAGNRRSDSLRFSPDFVDNDPSLFSSLEVYVAFFAESEELTHRFLYVPMDEDVQLLIPSRIWGRV